MSSSLSKVYGGASKVAAVEIGMPVKDLPPTCPYSLEQILDESFLPK